jgi:hypothetical protein
VELSFLPAGPKGPPFLLARHTGLLR